MTTTLFPYTPGYSTRNVMPRNAVLMVMTQLCMRKFLESGQRGAHGDACGSHALLIDTRG